MTSLRDCFRAVAALVMAVFALAFASQAYALDHPSATASPPGLEQLLADLPALPAAEQLVLDYQCAQTHTYLHAAAGGLAAWRSPAAFGAQLTRAVNGQASSPDTPLIE